MDCCFYVYFPSFRWFLELEFLFLIYAEIFTEMLAELSRREKAANIKPDPDIDIYMKVKINPRISYGLDENDSDI